MEVQVEILSGLPGSGKTHYAETTLYQDKLKEAYERENISVVHLDEEQMAPKPWIPRDAERVILDGLVLTNNNIISLIRAAQETNHYKRELKFTVVRWKEDRDTCLYNDAGRRNTPASDTIKYAKYEYPDVEAIKNATGYSVSVVEKQVCKKPAFMRNLSQNIRCNLHGDYLVSDHWVISGMNRHYNDSWQNVYESISGDPQPLFKELINFLNFAYPDMLFKHGIKILEKFSAVREFSRDDYYSSFLCGEYICNIRELDEYVREMQRSKGEK